MGTHGVGQLKSPESFHMDRWRRSAWPLETEDELAPVVEIKLAAERKVSNAMCF